MSPRGVYDRKTAAPRRAKAQPKGGGNNQPLAATHPVGEAMTEDIVKVSAKVRKALDDIRRPFTSFVADFASLSVSREELAPKFMRAFNLWAVETEGTFVEFVRVLIPDVPMRSRTSEDGPGYRDHRAYQAADYLRRLYQQAARANAGTPEERAQAVQNRPVSHATTVARLIRTLLPMLNPESQSTIWQALSTQLHWSPRMVERTQEQVQTEQPLVVIREPRGLHALGMLRLSMPTVQPTQSEEEETASSTQRTGTHG